MTSPNPQLIQQANSETNVIMIIAIPGVFILLAMAANPF